MTDNKQIKIPKKEIQNYYFMQTIGVGSLSRVKLAKEKKDSGKYVAIKILKKDQVIETKQIDHVHNELTILASLDHPFFTKLNGFMQDDTNLYFVLDLVPGGELFTYLREKGKLEVDQTAFYSSQIVLMLKYLHQKNIIYRDLKPENLIFDYNGYLKLVDFGFAKICEGRTFTLCGTPEYLAPEILLNSGHGTAVDFWTLGVIIYEMLTGFPPFRDEDIMNVYRKIIQGVVKFPTGFDKDAKSLVKHLVEKDLSKRYGNLKGGINDILEHRFFKYIDWSKLEALKMNPKYIPNATKNGEVLNFKPIEDDEEECESFVYNNDPFLQW